MKNLYSKYASDRIVWYSTLLSITVFLASVTYVFLMYRHLPPIIPLYNQLPWGEERLGQRIAIFIPNLIALVCIVLNLVLITSTYEKMPLTSRMISITSFLVSLIVGIYLFNIIRLIV